MLLGRYGYNQSASFVAATADSTESEAFWPTVAGLEFWGGSGAVWEMAPFALTHPSVGSAASDYRRFQSLLVDLAEVLDSEGLSGLAERNADLLRRELGRSE